MEESQKSSACFLSMRSSKKESAVDPAFATYNVWYNRYVHTNPAIVWNHSRKLQILVVSSRKLLGSSSRIWSSLFFSLFPFSFRGCNYLAGNCRPDRMGTSII